MNIFNKRSVQLLAAAVTGWCGCRAYDHVSSNSHIFAATLLPSQSVRLEPASSTGRPAQIMRFGFPGTDSVRFLNDYVMSYDRRNRTAHWVFEHLTKDSLQRNESVDRSKCEFQEDVDVHPYFRSLNSDYKKSGFDRGHLAAAGNHRKCQADVDQTFLLSNVAPQASSTRRQASVEYGEKLFVSACYCAAVCSTSCRHASQAEHMLGEWDAANEPYAQFLHTFYIFHHLSAQQRRILNDAERNT